MIRLDDLSGRKGGAVDAEDGSRREAAVFYRAGWRWCLVGIGLAVPVGVWFFGSVALVRGRHYVAGTVAIALGVPFFLLVYPRLYRYLRRMTPYGQPLLALDQDGIEWRVGRIRWQDVSHLEIKSYPEDGHKVFLLHLEPGFTVKPPRTTWGRSHYVRLKANRLRVSGVIEGDVDFPDAVELFRPAGEPASTPSLG